MGNSVYVVLFSVDRKIQKKWTDWMCDFYLPALEKTGCFEKKSCRIFGLTKGTQRNESCEFILSGYPKSDDAYGKFLQDHLSKLQTTAIEKFKGKFTTHRKYKKLYKGKSTL